MSTAAGPCVCRGPASQRRRGGAEAQAGLARDGCVPAACPHVGPTRLREGGLEGILSYGGNAKAERGSDPGPRSRGRRADTALRCGRGSQAPGSSHHHRPAMAGFYSGLGEF